VQEHVAELGCEVWAYDPSHSAMTQQLLFAVRLISSNIFYIAVDFRESFWSREEVIDGFQR
jgi:hypothetical protein